MDGVIIVSANPDQDSFNSLIQTLEAVRKTTDPEELAQLLTMANLMNADTYCTCELKSVRFGREAPETKACRHLAADGTREFLQAVKEILTRS